MRKQEMNQGVQSEMLRSVGKSGQERKTAFNSFRRMAVTIDAAFGQTRSAA